DRPLRSGCVRLQTPSRRNHRGWQPVTPLVLFLVAAVTFASDTTIRLNILRRYEGPECVAGEIRLGTKLLAYTLERPIEHNIPLISSIPEGEYAAFIREDGGKWRLELRDVPGRETVQIHIGNVIPHTVGCILLG